MSETPLLSLRISRRNVVPRAPGSASVADIVPDSPRFHYFQRIDPVPQSVATAHAELLEAGVRGLPPSQLVIEFDPNFQR